MTKRQSKSKAKKSPSAPSPAAGAVVQQLADGALVKVPSEPVVTVTRLEFPPPEYLLEEARGETNRKLLQDYWETIRVLRNEKGFSFREIADWLTENGVEADYNAVYRVYTKGMTDQEVLEVERQDALEGELGG